MRAGNVSQGAGRLLADIPDIFFGTVLPSVSGAGCLPAVWQPACRRGFLLRGCRVSPPGLFLLACIDKATSARRGHRSTELLSPSPEPSGGLAVISLPCRKAIWGHQACHRLMDRPCCIFLRYL